MRQARVSIVIVNCNYARFLQDAIDSSLKQLYPNVEIVVVDDGSTDDSRVLIAAAGDSVIPVLKSNGGQASALNAGFARSSGEIVIFLDADDVLLPQAVERVVAAFATAPEAGKVHYPLELVDAAGAPMGRLEPPSALMHGDLRRQIAAHYWYGSPPTSGNAFPRRVLESLFPIPEREYRTGAERFLVDLAPLFGPVVAVPEPCARYRQHGTNMFSHAQSDIEERFLSWVRDNIARMRFGRAHQRRVARELGLDLPFPAQEADAWLGDSVHRLISFKLDRPRHPVPDDGLGAIVWAGIRTTTSPGANPLVRHWQRLLQAAWFLMVAAAPTPAAAWLIKQYYLPAARVPLIQRLLERCMRRPEATSVAGP